MITVQYKEFNDYELLYMVNENDETAYTLLYEKYKPLVLTFAKKYANAYKNYGLDINDFIIEGYVGLDISINNFKEDIGHKFQGLVITCINRQMQNIVKQAKLKRNQILNNSLYYETINNYQDIDYLEVKEDEKGINPERIFIDIESSNELYTKLNSELKGIELEVFKLKAKGYNNCEIATILNKSIKSINNAITRIKKKYNKC